MLFFMYYKGVRTWAHSPCEIDSATTSGTFITKNGQIFPIQCADIDIVDAVVYIGSALVGMYLVCDC